LFSGMAMSHWNGCELESWCRTNISENESSR
jgi:hypothetical protein